ncbi:MAG: hypothetical protein KBF37_03990 [Saprospiraceae bacterium]|nr:hypothetical protein [Saprospiraceae bacterium]MBP9209464.1 hypothetical protein [Saprospiraceae bacterium]
MKKTEHRKTLLLLGMLFAIALSSCSRGYGCPYDFSAAEVLSGMAESAFRLFSILR